MKRSLKAGPQVAPGTVSRILWHFTGGPEWDATQKKQKTVRKPPHQAYSNLKSILRSKEVRLGGYKEIIRVIVPKRRRYNPETRKVEIQENVPVEISSAPICCLSDIPAAHLSYHAYRYGKFAIGFHRAAAVGHGFNPVFYTLEHTDVVRSIHKGFSDLQFADTDSITIAADEVDSALDDLEAVDTDDAKTYVDSVRNEADNLNRHLGNAKQSLARFLAFVKTFAANEFSTIYCEREWRSVTACTFSLADVAMIVLPRKIGRRLYFANFVEKVVPKLRIPTTIPVVPWEDLVEH